MAGQKYQDKRTKLPQVLLDQVNARDEDIASGAPTSRRRTADRRSARKSKKEDAKSKKVQFFSRHKEEGEERVKKRPAGTGGDDRPAKRPRFKDETTPAAVVSSKPAPLTSSNKAISTSSKPTPSTSSKPTPSTSSKPAPPASSKPAPSSTPPKPKITRLERLVQSKPKLKQQKDVEDDEIAWLEAKLGLGPKKKKKKGAYGGAFSADGLDDILLDLDRLEDEVDVLGVGDERDGEEDEQEPELETEEEESEEDDLEHVDSDGDSSDDASSEEDDEEEVPALKQPEPEPEAAEVTTRSSGAYVPPHLRQKTTSNDTATTAQTSEQTKLARQLKGLLNRLSEQNIEGIVTEVEALYRSNPRNDVTQALTNILLDSISSSANLLDTFVILHAAFIAAIHKIIGIEFAAYFVEQTVSSYETHWKSLHSATSKSLENPTTVDDSIPTGTKESSNLLVLLSELYNFQVISCVLVYDLIRALLDSSFLEHDVELLLKVVKNSGYQMRQDDPLALKDTIQLVQDNIRGKNPNELSSRFRFLVETLVNLKNNKMKDAKRTTGTGQNVASSAIERMKKYLGGINKKRHVMSHEPLRVSLDDLHSSDKRGKWWLVGSAWAGDPLVENQDAKATSKRKEEGARFKATVVDQLVQLARQHGMNTEIRRNIFVVLDYVDACERLTQLELQETQQREIVRVVLHCCGNERAYNPFYTLVAQHLCQKSHSHRITLQYCLWDFLRSLGETQVGGAAISRDFDTSGDDISDSTIVNYAKAYAWWLARGSVTLTIFKPLEFLVLQPRSKQFLKLLFLQMIISTQSTSPLVDIRSSESSIPQSRDRAAIEEITSKALRIPAMCKGIAYFIQLLISEEDFGARTKQAHELLVWGLSIAKEALRHDVLSDDDL